MPRTTPRQAPDEWTTSSYSGQQGDCVRWRRARSGAGRIEVGDSKNPAQPPLVVDDEAWQSFVDLARTFEV